MITVSNIQLTGQDVGIDVSDVVREGYESVILDTSNWQSSELYTSVIMPLKIATETYAGEFDEAVRQYMEENGTVLEKMKNSLNPSKGQRANKIDLSTNEYNNDNSATNYLMATMLKGHSLLLNIRKVLTGQIITTKFIVQTDSGFYEIDEASIESMNLVLSTFGGGTVSNPFSLAYQLDQELLWAQGLLTEERKISNKTDILKTIESIKPEYLERKKEEWKKQGVDKEYPNIYFDSKDAEIYELYQQQRGRAALDVTEYAYLRKKMGGGGGHASAFYQMGDVGSVQVKFFNLTKNNKKATVNFTRFSLLRDRFRQLAMIFAEQNPQKMQEKLISFFTEKEKNVLEGVSTAFNEQAKKALEELFREFA